MLKLIKLIVIAAAVWYAYGQYKSHDLRNRPATMVGDFAASAPATRESGAASFTCDGRTHCSQMRSCAEATYFIQHCPATKMDGDGDGVPCETQWCR